jgi:hypothetical protein
MVHDLAEKWRWLPALGLGLLAATLACSLLPGSAPRAAATKTPAAPAAATRTAAAVASTPAAGQPTPAAPTTAALTPTGAVPASTSAASAPTLAGPTPTLGASADITVQKDLTFGSGPFTLADPKVGLSDLSSYSATLTIAFDGTVNGQPSKWSRLYGMLASKSPAARQLTIQTSGDVSSTQPVYLAELDGAAYEQDGQGLCTATAVVTGSSLSDRLEPAGFLSFVAGADAAGTATVNNVAASHYTFDERALGQQGLTQTSGELWVAASGGYLVKYLLTTKATADYFGPGIAGTLTQDYELNGVGQPVSIGLPADCPAGMINAPRLPDATNVVNTPGSLSYDTATSLAEAAAFYQKQLPGLGWQPRDAADISATEALLDYTQGSQALTVSITTAAGVTNVNLVLGPAQP